MTSDTTLYGTLTLDRHGIGYAIAADEADYRAHFPDSDPTEVGAGQIDAAAVSWVLACYGEPEQGCEEWTTAKAAAILEELEK